MNNNESRSIGIGKIIFGWCIALTILPVIALFYIYKSFVILLAKVIRPDLRPLLSGLDIMISTDKIAEQDECTHEYERKPVKNIGFYIQVNSETNLQRFTRKVQTALDFKDSNWSWRYKVYLVRFYGYTFFKETSKFEVSKQIHKMTLKSGTTVNAILNEWILKPYVPRSPLWEFLLVDGKSSSEHYIAFKIHHVIADGLSMIETMNAIFDAENHSHVKEIINQAIPKYGFFELAKMAVHVPALLLNLGLKFAKSEEPFASKERNMNDIEQFTSIKTMRLSELKSISKKHAVSFMSVLLSIYAGGIRRYLMENGRPVPKDLFMGIPIPGPGRPKKFVGNHMGGLFVTIPLIPDTVARVRKIQSEMSEFHAKNMPLILRYVAFNLASLFPTCMLPNIPNPAGCGITPILTADEYWYKGSRVQCISGILGIFVSTWVMFASTVSHKNEIVWTVVGAKNVFKTQAELDIFLDKHIADELEEMLFVSGI